MDTAKGPANHCTQLHTRLSWVIAMIILGTVDMVINLCNNIHFSNPDLMRCLIIGPPSKVIWILQTIFTAIATVFYVLETLNTISIFKSDGETNFIPIHLELLVTLTVEHIPLAAINYFTAKCRNMYATPLQTMLGAVRIVFIFVRMVWYAHIEGKKVKKNDKYKIKRGFFMLVCVFFSCTMVFPIMIWRDTNSSPLIDRDLKDVSIYFLNLPDSLENRYVSDENIDKVVVGQGYRINHPYLVPSLLDVIAGGIHGYNATYDCNQNSTKLLPQECLNTNLSQEPASLTFRFQYAKDAPVCHLGEIRYNYAKVFHNQTCVPSTVDIDDDWKLRYYNKTVPEYHQGVTHVNLSSPWPFTCVTPIPWYDSQISVC